MNAEAVIIIFVLAALLGCLGTGERPSPAPSSNGAVGESLDNASAMIAEANAITEPEPVDDGFPSVV